MRTKATIICALSVLIALCQPFSADAKTKRTSKSAAATSQVVFTGEIAKKVIGYNGTTPLNITIENGRIKDIEALPNQETPQYFKRATARIFPQYIGKTVEEAKTLKVDAVTGATYSSDAIIKNIRLGLDQVKGGKGTKSTTSKSKSRRK